MILKEIDFLSPQITLYHKGSLSHSSIISGIISIISIIIIITFAICYSFDLIKRENPKVFFVNRFVENAGIFPLNSSSIFHYINLGNLRNLTNFDFSVFRAVGLESYYSYYLDDRNLSNYDHWLYGKCNFEKDSGGLGNLIDKENFEQGACIKKFFNSSERKYYDIENSGFKWPNIKYGTAHPESNGYSILLEKCKEDTLELILGKGNKCRNNSDKIDLFDGKWGTHFNFIDHYVDVLKYKNPNTKYFYEVQNILDSNNYAINHINLNPSTIITNDGVIFDNIIKELSFIFDRNDVLEEPGKNDDVYMVYIIWMKNRMQYYKRIYKTIQDVISDIGGVSEIVIILASFINSFYNNFKTISDFEKILSPNINNKENLKNKIDNIQHLTNNKINNSENTVIEKNINSKDNMNNIVELEKISKKNSNINDRAYRMETKYKEDSTVINSNNSENNNNNIQKNIRNNFWIFIISKISCKKKNNYFNIYKNLRNKIISEEHLLKNNLNVFSLLKMSESNGFELDNKFILNELISNG